MLVADEAHYLGVVDPDFTINAWRKLAAIVGTRNQYQSEQVYVIEAFVEDCIEERWSEFTLSRAIVAWRRSSERFMPTFGQLRACLQANGQMGGPRYYSRVLQILEKLARNSGYLVLENSPDEIIQIEATVSKMKAERKKGRKQKPCGRSSHWNRADELFLKGLEDKLAAANAGQKL